MPLADGFRHPPESARPWVYLFPLDGNLSREGITADLEAMHRVGLGGFILMETDQGAPKGPARFGGPLWREMFKHLCSEAQRLGLKVNMHNAAGWTGSGGPWITPELAMQKVVWTETVTSGPARFDRPLPQPEKVREHYRDLAVLAFPSVIGEESKMSDTPPVITASGMNRSFVAQSLLDDDPATKVILPRPEPGNPQWLQLEFAQPFTARSLTITPGWRGRLHCQGTLDVSADGRDFRRVREFDLVDLPKALAFEPVEARYYRLVFTRADGPLRQLSLAGVQLNARYCIDEIEGKSALGIVEYVPPASYARLASPLVIPRAGIVDLSAQMDSSGRLRWEVPPGRWTILRFGHTPTGRDNHPAPLEGRGLECDKLSKDAAEAAFNGLLAKLIAENKSLVGEERTLVSTHIDSWEVGSQNWTPRFREEFHQRRGYDLWPYFPVMTGRVVDSLEISERFLADLRQTISDLLVENYAGHFRTLARRQGLRLSIEAYDPPTNDLVYGGQADELMAEFWSYTPPGNPPWRQWTTEMASAAHAWGIRILAAEAFTAGSEERWQAHPYTLKSLGDWAFCEGINRFVFHRYAMQPWTNPDRLPGMSMGPWGVHYERTQTWWEQSKPWHEYLARCQYLLQQGVYVADICYLAAERSPQRWQPPVPMKERPGYNFDGCPAEVVLTRMTVKDGRLTLPDGTSYRVMVLPDVPTMTPRLLRKIGELVEAGATVIGARPSRSPSLTGYPGCDDEVRRLAQKLWGNCDGRNVTENRVGRGRIVQGIAPEAVLARAGIKPDFSFRTGEPDAGLRYTHRSLGNADLYFVANRDARELQADAFFRIQGRRPELWYPETGRIEQPGEYDEIDGTVRVPLRLGPVESVFVVFRVGHATEPGRITATAPLGEGTTEFSRPGLLRDENGNLIARSERSGEWTLRSADGKVRRVQIPPLPEPVTLAGSWMLRFPHNWGAPAQVELEQLISWSEHPEPGVRYFSGTATYTKSFEVPSTFRAGDLRVHLDLGRVAVMAKVKLNGRELGTLWKPPFRTEITDAIRTGPNLLEVSVVNLWINRMIGDEQLPPDSERRPNGTVVEWPLWLQEGRKSASGRFTFTSWPLWKKDDPLVESGLLGPVTLQSERVLLLKK